MKAKLNDKGQCPFCKIKPLTYKREGYYFCHRCDRAYNIGTSEQIDNYFYKDGERIIRKLKPRVKNYIFTDTDGKKYVKPITPDVREDEGIEVRGFPSTGAVEIQKNQIFTGEDDREWAKQHPNGVIITPDVDTESNIGIKHQPEAWGETVHHTFHHLQGEMMSYCVHDIEDNCFDTIEEIREAVRKIVHEQIQAERDRAVGIVREAKGEIAYMMSVRDYQTIPTLLNKAIKALQSEAAKEVEKK